ALTALRHHHRARELGAAMLAWVGRSAFFRPPLRCAPRRCPPYGTRSGLDVAAWRGGWGGRRFSGRRCGVYRGAVRWTTHCVVHPTGRGRVWTLRLGGAGRAVGAFPAAAVVRTDGPVRWTTHCVVHPARRGQGWTLRLGGAGRAVGAFPAAPVVRTDGPVRWTTHCVVHPTRRGQVWTLRLGGAGRAVGVFPAAAVVWTEALSGGQRLRCPPYKTRSSLDVAAWRGGWGGRRFSGRRCGVYRGAVRWTTHCVVHPTGHGSCGVGRAGRRGRQGAGPAGQITALMASMTRPTLLRLR